MGILKQRAAQASPLPFAQSSLWRYRSQVVLGSPKNGCNGVGICRMYMTTKEITTACVVIHVWLSDQGNGRLRIGFIKAAMAPRYLKRHFRWNLFQVLEPFELPGWAQRKLRLTQAEIDPGIYTVWETDEALVVDF